MPDERAARRFRVIVGQSSLSRDIRDRWPRSVPWTWVERFRERSQDNHNQTLERLNERGGLCPTELWRAAHDQPLFRSEAEIPTEQECGEWLIAEMARIGDRP